MKIAAQHTNYFLIFSLVLFSFHCRKPEKLVTCTPSIDAQEWFKGDAHSLTIQTIFEDSSSIYHSFKDSIQLPTDLYNEILIALSAFYDNYPCPQRDTVIDLLDIHHFPYYFQGKMIISFLKSKDWVQEFINGDEITSNELVKATFEKYKIKHELSLGEIHATAKAIVTVDSSLNLVALSKYSELKDLDGVVYVNQGQPFTVFGNNEDLSIEFREDSTFVKFTSFGGKYWKFGLKEDCLPFFMGTGY